MRRRRLCALDSLPNRAAAMLSIGTGSDSQDILLVREDDRVHGFVNACPHMGVELDFKPDRIAIGEGRFLRCSHHGAVFRVEDGLCIAGPCQGDTLERLPIAIRDGMVTLGGTD